VGHYGESIVTMNASREGGETPVRTWGVDLSTRSQHTGVVSIVWTPGERGVFTRHRGELRTRRGLVFKIAETCAAEWWAVDVPFGWPDHWADFLQRHRMGPAQLPVRPAVDEAVPWAFVARRVTDTKVVTRDFKDRKRTPGFSVTFDKLGATAAAWSWIEWSLAEVHDKRIDRSGMTENVKVCETYPAAAWRKWFATGSPASSDAATLASCLDGVVLPHDGEWKMSNHEADALVCALVSRARAMNRTDPPDRDELPIARHEGWIHL
jgi:hypothetical protein